MYEYNHEILTKEELLELVIKAKQGCKESMEEIIIKAVNKLNEIEHKLQNQDITFTLMHIYVHKSNIHLFKVKLIIIIHIIQ